MNAAFLRGGSTGGILSILVLSLVAIALPARADQIEMKNGDRYSGKVITLETNTVVLNSELLGTLRIRRDQVASISVGTPTSPGNSPGAPSSVPLADAAVPKAPPVPVISSSAAPNPRIDPTASLAQQIAANPQLVQEVQKQVLAGAGPEALKKYNSLVDGLSSGSLNMDDLRKEAASVAAQLRQNRGSGDDESAAIFDEYLSILDSFLAETESTLTTAKPSTNATKPVDAPKQNQ